MVVGDAGGAAKTLAVAVPTTTQVTGRSFMTARITVADMLTVSPVGAELGTKTCARRAVTRFALIIPSGQVWVPSPPTQEVKVGAGKLGDELPDLTEICTVTSAAAPPACQTRTWYRAA